MRLQTVPASERDALLTLQLIHSLHLSPLSEIGRRADWQHHAAVAALKSELEQMFLAAMDDRLDRGTRAGDGDAVGGIRAVASEDLVPPVYDWLAERASAEQVRTFLALEGGPDAGFDDLVAVCQIGLSGEPKLELAQNYWDEMGRGSAPEVHTTLHRDCVEALQLSGPAGDEQPLEGLRRSVLTGVLATNRRLQPELVGALGTIEIQAGPRCRRVVRALERVGSGDQALGFYREHAVADPRHGKDWLDHVVRPLAQDPSWRRRMVRGAEYRCMVNREFFASLEGLASDDRRVA